MYVKNYISFKATEFPILIQIQKSSETENINGKQHLCQDFGSSVPDSRCGNIFCQKLDLINILEKICVSVYYLKDYNISYLKT
jgi:hypothetical protein